MTTININNHEFIVRNINNKVVASTALQNYVNSIEINPEISSNIKSICLYIDPMKLINMTDKQLQDLIEESNI